MARVLEGAIDTEDPDLREMAQLLVLRGGKRIRPALVLTAACFGDVRREALIAAAAAMELMHVASLYHDDVMDRAPLRRGGVSANDMWGNARAALAGTYLFTRSSALLATLGDEVNRLSADVAERVCTGQLHEVENAFNLELTEGEHLEILTQKTAALLELPCRLGGILSGAPQTQVDALAGYGRHLGLAFQLADDALDLAGVSRRMGKATSTDLREGIYSLPVLRALGGPNAGPLRELLGRARIQEKEIDAAVGLVRAGRGVEEVLQLARSHAGRAAAQLEELPVLPARQSLVELATYVVSRAA